MGAEVWGTLAVNDHMQRAALLREVLLFDRLVVPVPATAEERTRWYHPNPNNPDETWDPDGLDNLLKILGTQRHPSTGGAPLVWESDWDEQRWQANRSRLELAATITEVDAFYSTRLILSMDENLPDAIEAMAAYPSEQACAAELAPKHDVPMDLTAADALVLLATPLLVPDVSDGDYERAVVEAAQLARSPRVCEERAAYHDFVRDFVSRLRMPGMDLGQVQIDIESLDLARNKLEKLLSALSEDVSRDSRRARWGIVEWVLTALGCAATVGLAFTAPYVAVAAGGGLCSFVGWVAGKRGELPQQRPLNGASIFVSAPERLACFTPAAIRP
jgi:hypothetical protein